MKPNIRYVVTKASQDKTFKVGDKVRLLEDGDILSETMKGWIDAANVASATLGWEIEIDKEWQSARIAKLQAEIDRIQDACVLQSLPSEKLYIEGLQVKIDSVKAVK